MATATKQPASTTSHRKGITFTIETLHSQGSDVCPVCGTTVKHGKLIRVASPPVKRVSGQQTYNLWSCLACHPLDKLPHDRLVVINNQVQPVAVKQQVTDNTPTDYIADRISASHISTGDSLLSLLPDQYDAAARLMRQGLLWRKHHGDTLTDSPR